METKKGFSVRILLNAVRELIDPSSFGNPYASSDFGSSYQSKKQALRMQTRIARRYMAWK